MTIQGAFRRMIFGRKGVDDGPPPSAANLHPAIIAELRRLDLYSPGLGARATAYVATGANPDVIAKIDACQKATPVHMAPYHKDSNALHGAAIATARAIVTGEIAAGPEIGRLLQIHLATRFFTISGWQNIPPERHLLAAMSAMLSRGVTVMSYDHRVHWDKMIPLPQAFEHMKQLGGTMVDLFEYILARAEGPNDKGDSWYGGAACGAFITTYPRAFAEALRAAERTRRAAVRLAEYYGAVGTEEVSGLLVEMLTKPFGKDDREIAMSALARLDEAPLLALLEEKLAGGDIDTRFGLVQAAARNGSAKVLALLEERGKTERAAKVKAAIDAALESQGGTAADMAEAAQGEPGFAAIDGSFLTLPAKKDISSDEPKPVSDQDRAEYRRIAQTIVDDLRQQHDSSSSIRLRIAEEDIDPSFALLTQGTPLPQGFNFGLSSSLRRRDDGRAWFDKILDSQPLGIALRIALANAPGAVTSAINNRGYIEPNARSAVDRLTAWLENGDLELRHIASAQQLRTLLTKSGYSYDRRNEFATLQDLPGDAVWPWIAESLPVIDEALGLQPSSTPLELDRALSALALLPQVPQRYFARLLEIAVTEKRPLRRQAMALLGGAKDLVARVEALLDDARQQVRINAATWLADLRSEASEPPLRKRLKKEKSDPVRAALISALQRLGADLGDVIGPDSLIAEAEAAAAKAAPTLPDWMPAGLPAARFRDGKTVPGAVLRHWLSLAIRLKDPGASGQFGIYLDQLDPADARALSNWVLESWISYDTQASSLDEANAYALANYHLHWRWQYQPRQSPQLRDEIIAELAREKTGELLNSGSDSKGMLALACRADAVWAANRVRWFLKKHGRRSNQAMALLEVLAGIDEPAALQVVIAASARLKQKSTQARANEIAERYAEDRGWSFDELADRTVPSAGFDDDGVLDLPCGEESKPYSARLDASLAIHLFNPDGNPVKALPAGDDENSKESKKALAGAKKELAQVIELQAARLFEAMCVERDWPVADWRMAFHEHPVMRRLIERLVWQGLDAEGRPLAMFRPTQEGDFTDAADNAVDIDAFAKLRLAHGALTDEANCKAWIAHLKDYEIKPFLAQFDTLRAPLSDAQGEEEVILDREGWTADSLTFRGVAEKRGYERIMRDGGGCNEYQKSFPSHGITATIFHTGSYAVDENNRVALKELRFAKQGHRGPFRLKHVPAIMLAECWADYHAVAAKGAFEAEWEKVSPW